MATIRIFLSVLVSLVLAGTVGSLDGSVLQGGRLTQVRRDVQIAESGGSPKRAATNADVRGGLVRTGVDSRAEVTFTDQSVVRLGDKTEIGIDSQSRAVELKSGALLTQIPAGVG